MPQQLTVLRYTLCLKKRANFIKLLFRRTCTNFDNFR